MIIMGTKRKPRKSNPVNDIANLTKIFGIMQTIGAGKAVLGSLETLKDFDRRTKKRKKR